MKQLTHSEAQTEISLFDFVSILRRRRRVITTTMLTCLVATIIICLVMPKSWISDAQLVLEQRAATSAPKMPQDPQSTVAAGQPDLATIDTPMAMIQSDGMYQRTMDWLRNDPVAKSQATPEMLGLTLKEFYRRVSVMNPKLSNIMVVSAEEDSPAHAALLANAVCQAFVAWKKELARQDLLTVEQNLSMQEPPARQRLADAQAALSQYEKQHGFVNAPDQEQQMVAELQARDMDVASALESLRSNQARLSTLQDQLRKADLAIRNSGGAVRDDNQVSTLQTNLDSLLVQRENLARQFTEAYPGQLAPIDAQIAATRAQLKTALKATLDDNRPWLADQGTILQSYQQQAALTTASQANLIAAQNQLNQVRAQLTAMPRDATKVTELQQAVDLASQQYANLEGALSATRLDLVQVHSDVEFAQSAILPDPNLPYMPNWPISIVLAILLGIFLSAGIVLFLEQSDRRVHSIDDVRRLVSGQIVGSLPLLSRAQIRKLTRGGELPKLQESLLLTRVNLQLMMHRARHDRMDPQQVILFTSAAPREGKSIAAAEMARSIAATGNRVILVDANLRRPTQHMLFNVAAQAGLSEVLQGELDLRDAIIQSGVDNLWLVQSGHVKDSPTDLLTGPSLADILNSLRREADTIIIDAPDCNTVTDTVLLAMQSDVLVQVIGIDRVDDDLMLDTAVALQSTGKTAAYLINFSPKQPKSRVRGDRSIYHAFAGIGAAKALTSNTTWPALEKELLAGDRQPPRDVILAKAPHNGD